MPERILVVDDDYDVRNVVTTFLEREGFFVKGIGDAAAALAEIRNDYDLAIVDIMLPDASGVELMPRLKQVSPLTEIIFITGYASLDTAINAIELGSFAYIKKPLELEQLYHTVTRALEKRRLIAENQRLLSEMRKVNRRLEELNITLEGRVAERTRELLDSQRETENKARQLSIINEITNAITSSLNPTEILTIIARETKKIIEFDRASISITDGAGTINKVFFLEPSGTRRRNEGLTYPLEGTGIERVIKNRKPLIRSDLTGVDEFPEDEFIQQTGMKSGIVVPLIYRENVIGTLSLGSVHKNAYSEDHVQILGQIAGQIAIALENAALYRELRDYSGDLESKVAARTEELRENLRELKEAQERLVQSEKLAATSKLIAGVAHEIKNPLNSMSFATTNIEKALSSKLDAGKIRQLCGESLSILRSDIARLKDMVDTFMAFTKPTRIERKEAAINGVIQEVARGIIDEFGEKGITITEKYDESIPPLKLEEGAFHQLILNLLLNSRDAVKPGGRIELATRLEGRNVLVEVSDDGCGIPPEMQDKVFDIFFTTKADGAGLGLSQVYRTVESHGGTITFQSKPGEGTSFRIALPPS